MVEEILTLDRMQYNELVYYDEQEYTITFANSLDSGNGNFSIDQSGYYTWFSNTTLVQPSQPAEGLSISSSSRVEQVSQLVQNGLITHGQVNQLLSFDPSNGYTTEWVTTPGYNTVIRGDGNDSED